MGANDAGEQLEAAKAEVVRLEQIIRDALDIYDQYRLDPHTYPGVMALSMRDELIRYKEAK